MSRGIDDLGPVPAPRREPGESEAAYQTRYRAWVAQLGGAGLSVGLPAPTTRFGTSGEQLGQWSIGATASLPSPTHAASLYGEDGGASGANGNGSTALSVLDAAYAPPERPAPTSVAEPPPPWRMGGALPERLREPIELPAPDLERARVLAATGFDPVWGTPPGVTGLVWNEARFLYEPTRDPAGLPYRQAEREGVYAQAYRPAIGPLGGWAMRWVRVVTTLPDEARPYRVLSSTEASAVETDVGRYALEARSGGTSSVWDRLRRGEISIDPPGTPSVRSGASNDTPPIVTPLTSPAPLEVPLRGLNGQSSIVGGTRNAGAWLRGSVMPDILPLPDVASAVVPVRRQPVLPCSSHFTTVSDQAMIRLFVGSADPEKFLMTDAPSRRKGQFSMLPDEPVVLAVESHVPYLVQHTCRCGSSECLKETSVLARADIEWTTPYLSASARGARIGVHSVNDDDVHASTPRLMVPGSSVLLLPPRLGVDEQANVTVWVAVTVPAGRVADGGAFTARLSVLFKIRRTWDATGSSVRAANQEPTYSIMARQDRYEYEFEATSRGDPQQVLARHIDRLSCDCTPMEPTVKASLSMESVEAPPPFTVHEGDVVRLRWGGSGSWRAELRCKSEECTVPPPIEIRAESALSYWWSAHGYVDGSPVQFDRHEFIGPKTLESVLIRVPVLPASDTHVMAKRSRGLWITVVVSDGRESRSETFWIELQPRRVVSALLIVVHGGHPSEEHPNGRGYNPHLESLGARVARTIESSLLKVESHLRVLSADQSSRSCKTSPADMIAKTVLEWIDRVVSKREVVGPIVMLGHSWGANAIALAARVLERVGVGIDRVFAIDRTACGGFAASGLLPTVVGSAATIQPDVGTNVMLVDNVTAGGDSDDLGASSFGVSVGNATRYRPVWCARINRNLVVPGIGHSTAEEDPRSVRFIIEGASGLTLDLYRRRFAVMNSRRPCTGVVDQGGRRLTEAKALAARLEVADAELHGTLRSCEKPGGYEGR